LDNAGYRGFHAPRYAYLLRLLEDLGANADSRMLDIGASHLTDLMREKFGARVDTLGFGEDLRSDQGNHYCFNLNDAQSADTCRTDLPQYDLIVMAEVLEHLYVAPQLSLAFTKKLLLPNGRLIVQTPNAASLRKRIKLLFGQNPYEMIRIDPENPGHYREYTIAELRGIADELNLLVDRCETGFYFDTRFVHDAEGRLVRHNPFGAIKNAFYRNLPGNLREGITLVLRHNTSKQT